MFYGKRAKSKTGLLFSRIETYEEKVWREALAQARERGLSPEEARKYADEAKRYAAQEVAARAAKAKAAEKAKDGGNR